MEKFVNYVTINIKLVYFRVSVLGEVKNPGSYTFYSSGINLLQAIALAGDIGDFVSDWHRSKIEISVYEYLGCSEEQYAILIRYPEYAEDIRANPDKSYSLAKLRSLQPWK